MTWVETNYGLQSQVYIDFEYKNYLKYLKGVKK